MSNRKLTELFDHSSKLVDLLKRQPDRGGGRNRHIHEPGERFGAWTVVGMVEERRHGAICYLVRCVCGIEKVVPGGALRFGSSTRCRSCARRSVQREVPDLVGRRFGYWLVLRKDPERYRHDKSGSVFVRWVCKCTYHGCGTIRSVIGGDLRSGKSKSCGCLQRERASECNRTHGMSHTRPYWRWSAMRQRCRNKNNPQYDDYGGREPNPITICEYYSDFQNYYADWGDAPSSELSLDRTENERGYSPDNLRWTDRHTQRMNQRPPRPRAKTKTKQERSPPPSDPEEDIPW